MRRYTLLAATALMTAIPTASPLAAQDATEVPLADYPDTYRQDVSEEIFGETIADPYRWLEDDVRNNPEVANWVASQNRVSEGYLAALPAREWFGEKIGELYNYERFSTPTRAGDRYFYTRNTGLQNQSPLYVREGLAGEERLLIDPNAWSDDDAAALSGWVPSPDGKYVLYSVQDGGTDWRIVRVLDVDSGRTVGEDTRWVKFSNLAWVGNDGFLYSRFPEPEAGQDFQALNYGQQVFYHKLGTTQDQDELVFETPEHRERGHTAAVTHDGRWAVITSSLGTDAKYETHLIDLSRREAAGWTATPLVTGFENDWSLIDGIGSRLFFRTDQGAPKSRVVAIDMAAANPRFDVVVPEKEEPIDGVSLVGSRMIVSYLKDAASKAVMHNLTGKVEGQIELNGIGSAGGFTGNPDEEETFYSFSSFNRPGAVYRLDLASGETTTFAEPEVAFDPDDFVVEQRFYPSKDGTKVPMFIVRKRSIAEAGQAAPTLLYGYGGFSISLTPGYSASRMAWLQAGGAYALANLRGGGEYGKEWHDAGRRANKQNVFDDFIAAGEFLKAEGIATENGLAIQGGSNGGLLVGAVTNQRPDLFDAANAAVGVMDMLRFDRWTAGRYWVDDYGYPDREEDFRILRAYSPYHNIRSGAEYPAVLVTTADTDDRVVPGHSFKYTAALQAADTGDKPHIIRVETRAGHGSGKPTDKAIAEAADVLSFLAAWTGLEPKSE